MKLSYLLGAGALAALFALAAAGKGKAQSAADKSAALAFNEAQSFATQQRKKGLANVKVQRVDGGPGGFPKGYAVAYGDPGDGTFGTAYFPAAYTSASLKI